MTTATRRRTPINGNGARKPGQAAMIVRKAKPLVDDLSLAVDYALTRHAVERMAERNIGAYEVLSALVDPDTTRTNQGVLSCSRGDIRIVVNPENRTIISVIDLEEDERVTPRKVLSPTFKQPTQMKWDNNDLPARQLVEASLPERKQRKTLPETEEVQFIFGDHEQEDIRFCDVSPVIAAALLERNTQNRPKRGKDVEDWADQMSEGRWLIVHQGIALARNGVVVDGQHRLEAVVDSGVTVRMPVCVGLDPKVFEVIDAGRKRSTSDTLALVGEKQSTLLAAVSRIALLWDTNRVLTGGGLRIHTDEIMRYREDKEDALREATRWAGNSVGVRHGFNMMKAAAGAGYYLLKRELPRHQGLVDIFLDGLVSGISLKARDPRYALRRSLANDEKRSTAKHLAMFLKTWSLFVRDEEARVVTWRVNEDMPKVFVPPPGAKVSW